MCASPAPVIECCNPSCRHILATIWQPGFGEVAGYWLLTCENLDCDLYGQTATVDTYPFPNIERYYAYGRAHRSEREARKLHQQTGASE
jgi:hypothetical protein